MSNSPLGCFNYIYLQSLKNVFFLTKEANLIWQFDVVLLPILIKERDFDR